MRKKSCLFFTRFLKLVGFLVLLSTLYEQKTRIALTLGEISRFFAYFWGVKVIILFLLTTTMIIATYGFILKSSDTTTMSVFKLRIFCFYLVVLFGFFFKIRCSLKTFLKEMVIALKDYQLDLRLSLFLIIPSHLISVLAKKPLN